METMTPEQYNELGQIVFKLYSLNDAHHADNLHSWTVDDGSLDLGCNGDLLTIGIGAERKGEHAAVGDFILWGVGRAA